jgi:hypothetical protein
MKHNHKTALALAAATFMFLPRLFAPIQLQPIIITNITVDTGSVVIQFTGTAFGDPASNYTLLNSTNVDGPFTATPGATIIQTNTLNPNLYQATAATNGPQQFYRITGKKDALSASVWSF